MRRPDRAVAVQRARQSVRPIAGRVECSRFRVVLARRMRRPFLVVVVRRMRRPFLVVVARRVRRPLRVIVVRRVQCPVRRVCQVRRLVWMAVALLAHRPRQAAVPRLARVAAMRWKWARVTRPLGTGPGRARAFVRAGTRLRRLTRTPRP